MNGRILGALAAVIFAGGMVAGVLFEHRREEARGNLRRLAEQAGVAGLCQGALAANDSARPAVSRRLLEQRLVSSIDEANRLVKSSAEIDFPVPNLVEGVRRAQEYASRNGMQDTAAKCDAVIAFLRRGFAHA